MIIVRPPEIADRAVSDHWEGSLMGAPRVLPQGIDLSDYNQGYLDAVAFKLNGRPDKSPSAGANPASCCQARVLSSVTNSTGRDLALLNARRTCTHASRGAVDSGVYRLDVGVKSARRASLNTTHGRTLT